MKKILYNTGWTVRPGFEGKSAVVRVLSASPEVELFLNGVSLGRKATEGHEAAFSLNYEPGELLAVGCTGSNEDGRFALHTAGGARKARRKRRQDQPDR